MAYKAPIWEDGKSPAISAENLNNLSQAAEGAQVLYGNSAPTSSTEGVVGQFYLVVVADANGNYALYQCVGISDSAYNWKLLGTTPVYAKVSNPVAEILGIPSGSSVEFALISNFAPIKIASYETAGAYEWTAPDLSDGKAYKIGVLVIGAGGSGGLAASATGSASQYATGGASGFSISMVCDVNPGDIKPLVVGAGGPAVTSTGYTDGKSGGTSSFDGATASGGEAGTAGNSSDLKSSGGQGSATSDPGEYGRAVAIYRHKAGSSPSCCFNPFEGTDILGSGGPAYQSGNNGSVFAYSGGKNPLTNKGGGDGVNGTIGKSATEPGCGGGAVAYATRGAKRTSGAGADGAVYIYFLGVTDE